MSMQLIFQSHLVLGHVAWGQCFGAYIWPWLKVMEPAEAQRAIATLYSFRFFGLVFIIPGVVGPDLPASFAAFSASWDFATGLLAMLALLTGSLGAGYTIPILYVPLLVITHVTAFYLLLRHPRAVIAS